MIVEIERKDMEAIKMAIAWCRRNESDTPILEAMAAFNEGISKCLLHITPREIQEVLEPTGAISPQQLLASYRSTALNFSGECWRVDLREGSECDALDTVRNWYLSTILERNDDRVLVHYQNWSPQWVCGC